MLTDILKPRIVELGSIRIGKKGEERQKRDGSGTYRLPQKLDHFLITTLNRDEKSGDLILDRELMDSLCQSGFGDEDGNLRKIPIRVLSNDPEDIMQASYCWYVSRKLGAKSDGKTTTFYVGFTKEDWLKPLDQPRVVRFDPAILDWTDNNGNKLFKAHVIFNCVIASESAKFGGVYKFRTTSAITGSQIYGGLLHILELTNGVLAGMPLQLVIRPIQITPKDSDGKQITTKVYIVHVELVGTDLRRLQERAAEQAKWELSRTVETKTALAQYRKVLRTPGDEIDPAEVIDVQTEFHPEEQANGFPQPEASEPDDSPPPPAEKTEEPTEDEKKDKKRVKAENEVKEWKDRLKDVGTLTDYGELCKPGGELAKFYTSLSRRRMRDLMQELADYAKSHKLGLCKAAIQAHYEAGAVNDGQLDLMLKQVECKDIKAITVEQAEQILKAIEAINK